MEDSNAGGDVLYSGPQRRKVVTALLERYVGEFGPHAIYDGNEVVWSTSLVSETVVRTAII